MKHIFISLALLSLFFTGCDNQEQEIVKNPSYVPKGHSALDIKIRSAVEPKSYAVGDELLPSAATTEEKKVSSVAVFVQTPADGFFNFFSKEEEMTLNGLDKGLEEIASGEYTATVLVKGMHLDDNASRVVIIANYAENNIDFSGVLDMDDVDKIMSNAFTESPVTPLLMYSAEDVQFVTDDRVNKTFALERMVARVDIENKASELKGGGEGFVLVSAQLVNAKERTYLKPEHEKSLEIGVTDFPEVHPAPGATVIDTLYLFENNNQSSATATALRIKGTFKGTQVSQLIEFKKPDGTTVAVERNKRYKVEINPAHDSTEITFNLVVKDWELGDTIQVPVVKDVPELASLDMSGFTAAGAVWDATNKTLDVTSLADNNQYTFTFTAFCNQETAPAVGYSVYSRTGSAPNFLDGAVTVGDHEIVPATRANGFRIKADYTATFSKPSGNTPVHGLILIQNSQNIQTADTITVKYVPDYYDDVYTSSSYGKPVFYKGQYWAPVNCGGSSDLSQVGSVTSITTDAAVLGNLYQWGRKVLFTYTGTPDMTTFSDAADFPVYADGCSTTGTYADKFIKGILGTNYSWFKDYAASATAGLSAQLSVSDGAWPHVNQPCPAGWRIPTKEELEKILGETPKLTDGKFIVPDTDGKFVLPAAGYRDAEDGDPKEISSSANYWSSALLETGNSFYLNITGSGAKVEEKGLANGYSVRCIQY